MVNRLFFLSLLSASIFAEQFTVDMFCMVNNATVQKTICLEENAQQTIAFDNFDVALHVASFNDDEVTLKANIATTNDQQLLAASEIKVTYGVPATLVMTNNETNDENAVCIFSFVAAKN